MLAALPLEVIDGSAELLTELATVWKRHLDELLASCS